MSWSLQALESALAQIFEPRLAALVVERHGGQLARHGKFAEWTDAVAGLPTVATGWHLEAGWLHAGEAVSDIETLSAQLKIFLPWRKGPLVLAGVPIETEWRSDWKWNRVAPHIDLTGARILDVGAGNGYFGWRMLEHGAETVVACDPTQLFVAQHAVISHFAGPAANHLLALRLEALPPGLDGFDVVFSMGVLYHRREPQEHLGDLRTRLRSGGTLVLETLVLPDEGPAVLVPPGRYAGMRNVHALPSVASLYQWLADAGYTDARCVDLSLTGEPEQRQTEWMPFHSLAEALDPADSGLTIEGLPRPRRALVLART